MQISSNSDEPLITFKVVIGSWMSLSRFPTLGRVIFSMSGSPDDSSSGFGDLERASANSFSFPRQC